jgi:hypothetical protein
MPLFIALSALVAISTAILLHQYRHRAFDASASEDTAAADAEGGAGATTSRAA